MPRFYLPRGCQLGQILDLPDSLVRHIQVLRLQPGDAVTLFDGHGQVYAAAITTMGKKKVTVCIQAAQQESRESPLHTTLLQSVSSSERMDWTIQKSVELGINRIVPVVSERSSQRLAGERADKKTARWQEIAIAACEQCGRAHVPEITPVQGLSEALATLPPQGSRLLLSLHRPQALNQLPAPKRVVLLAGPEGGLSTAEENLAIIDFGFQAIQLGPRVLRTETAAPAALAAMQVLWGDWRIPPATP